MDKELLRIAIIGTGLIIMVAMIISAYLKDRQTREEDDDYYDDEEFEEDELFDDDEIEIEQKPEPVKKSSIGQSIVRAYSQTVQQIQNITPPPIDNEKPEIKSKPKQKIEEQPAKAEPQPATRPAAAQAILQFSVITRGNDDFNVADVFHVLEGLGLEYGSMKVFERIDEDRLVHFCVANMTDLGTFPDEDLESHYCPGVVFFMQFDGLENPKAVFDDYVHTAVVFASQMDGVVLDHRRQPLTDAMVNAIRNSLDNY